MSLNDDINPIASVAESLLVSITDIIESILCIQTEQENLLDVGCYLYRASAFINELRTTEPSPTNALEILQSLSKGTDLTKNLIGNFQKADHPFSSVELRIIMSKLERVIKDMGEALNSIPSSTYNDQEYAEVAVKSLSKEMQNGCFLINNETQVSKPNELEKTETDLYAIDVDVEMENSQISVFFNLSAADSLNSTSATRTRKENVSTSVPTHVEMEREMENTQISAMSSLSAAGSLNSTSATTTRKKNVNTSVSTHVEREREREMENTPIFVMSDLSAADSLNSTSTTRTGKKTVSMSSGSIISPQLANYMEPLYDAFFCPLTKKMMENPVTIETGVTYERKAIAEWLNKFTVTEEIRCPVTKQRLVSKVLSTNIALKTTIEEWKDRNEAARIKVARSALSLASSAKMILEALDDLQSICQRKEYNKVQIRNVGIIPLLVMLLEYKDRKVRCATLEMFLLLAKDDEDGKIMIVNALDVSKIVKMLSNSHKTIRHASLLVLLELSQSQSLSEKFGSVAGGILMLITIKLNQFNDAFASDKADKILKNLERSPNNIIRMAENGLLDPLLNHLTDGSEEMKMEIGNYLGDIVFRHDTQNYVAEKASPTLIKMVHSTNPLTKMAAFKALKQISSYHPNGKILIEIGMIQIMMEETFAWRKNSELMDSSKEAAAIVANILESGTAFETLPVNSHGHTMGSDYIVFNIVHTIKNSTPNELNINLIRILLCLAKSPKSRATIISVVKETEGSYTLIEFINNPDEELGIAAIKLLIILSPFMGHTLADRICKTKGLPENLIHCSNETTYITEKQAVSADLLAKLPHQNLRLNLALLNKDIVPIILQKIDQIQSRGMETSRYASAYLESLVGILVRFTTTLYEPQMLFLARNHNFTLKFTEMLVRKSSDEVQRLSAIGLENLSSVSVNLSKPPQIKTTRFKKLFNILKFLSFGSIKKKQIPVCPVHRGVCSSQNTFCLVDANAVERLLHCLEHENADVAEAALSTICTLMDDKVDLDKSLNMLSEVNAIELVLNIVKERKQVGLWEKSFWIIERFLMKGGDKSTSDISRDRSLHSALVSALHHGDGNTKQMAERILMHLNKMPNYSVTN